MSDTPPLYPSSDTNRDGTLSQQEIVEALKRGGVASMPIAALLGATQSTEMTCALRDLTVATQNLTEQGLENLPLGKQAEFRKALRESRLLMQSSDNQLQDSLDTSKITHASVRMAFQTNSPEEYRQRLTAAGFAPDLVQAYTPQWEFMRNSQVFQNIGALERVEIPTTAQLCDGLRPGTTPLLPDPPSGQRRDKKHDL